VSLSVCPSVHLSQLLWLIQAVGDSYLRVNNTFMNALKSRAFHCYLFHKLAVVLASLS
jgi:uncharacterized membrane protein YdbT with pleckstrin-like domain